MCSDRSKFQKEQRYQCYEYQQVSNSGIMERISERPDVESTNIEGRDTRNRSRISFHFISFYLFTAYEEVT